MSFVFAIVPDTSAQPQPHARTYIKMITPELFVNLAKGMFGGYSAMMLLMPKKMVTDHFKAECDPVRPSYIQRSPTHSRLMSSTPTPDIFP